MYAVVKASGRQYRVSPGDRLSVEKIEGNLGSNIDLNEVLMVGGDKLLVGTPTVKDAKVIATIEKQYRGDKLLVYKKKRRHKYRKMRGHRSELTMLFISEVVTPHGSFKAETKAHVIDPVKQAAKKADIAKKYADAKADGSNVEKKAAAPKKKAPAKKKKKMGGARKSAAKKKKTK